MHSLSDEVPLYALKNCYGASSGDEKRADQKTNHGRRKMKKKKQLAKNLCLIPLLIKKKPAVWEKKNSAGLKKKTEKEGIILGHQE